MADPDRQPDRAPDAATGRAPDRDAERDRRTGRSAAEQRIANQGQWVDLQIREAMARGEFDDLPGAGKPIKDLGVEHDADWWLKKLVEREQVTGVLPPPLQIRKEDAELDGRLDRITTEEGVRREVAEFNAHVRRALYTPPTDPRGWPPMITRPRDVETEVVAWRARREARVEAQREAQRAAREEQERARRERRRWWSRRCG